MSSKDKIQAADLETLRVIHYPDPRLFEICSPVETVNEDVRRLAEKMLQLMFESHGVGLAAPQVGITVRMFVASPSFDPGDTGVYINPQILSAEGSQETEEGCLSLPGISCKLKRADIVTIQAMDLEGNLFEETGEGLTACIYQHEYDHLDGKMLVDRMGTVAKMANRKTLLALEEEFEDLH